MRIRLILAIVTSLLDEVIILALILWGLPALGVEVPRPYLIPILLAVAVYAVLTFRMGTRALLRKPVAGLTSMVGTRGRVVRWLGPSGQVKIAGEIWEARTDAGNIEPDVDVEVIAQDGLKLTVKPVSENEVKPRSS